MGGRWETAQLLILVGLWALMVGMVGVYRSISTGGAAAWARLGFYGVIVGTTLGTLHHGIELGFPALVEEWEEATGSDKAMLLQIGTSIRQVDLGIIDVSAIVLSLALTFLGVGMVLSRGLSQMVGLGHYHLGGRGGGAWDSHSPDRGQRGSPDSRAPY